MRVIVDDRERGSGTVEVLQGFADVTVCVQRIPVGDYVWDDRLLFERKTLDDLVVSIKDGRLLRQACRLASAPQKAVLILEGAGPFFTGMKREAIQGAIVTITLLLGIPILRSTCPEETARLMLYSARQVDRMTVKPLPRFRQGKRPRGKRKAQLEILQGLPGIGPERAKDLLHRFGSVEAVVNADIDELRGVPGIGPGTSKAIRWAVSEPPARYGRA